MTPEKLKETQEYIDFVKNNLEPLAGHLKVGVDWLWQILVNQVRVEAIVYLVVIVLMSIKASTLLFIAYKASKKAVFGHGYSWEKGVTTNVQGYIVYWCGIGGAVLLAASTLTAAFAMPKIVTGLINPEYGAIERIVQFSQGKIPNQGNK